jgi:hypothetical protein
MIINTPEEGRRSVFADHLDQQMGATRVLVNEI